MLNRRIAFILGGVAAAMLAAALASAAPSAGQKAPKEFQFKSEKIALPLGALKFPAGKWGHVANQRCLICHSRDMIDTQPPLSLAVWKAEVIKMEEAYKCPLPPDAVDGLAAFMHSYNNQHGK